MGEKKWPASVKAPRTLVDVDHPQLSTARQCELLGLGRSSFYCTAATETRANLALVRLIDRQYTAQPYYGSRRMTVWLQGEGHEVNRQRVHYDAVDPLNRLVARALERQWEQALVEQQRLEEDHARFRAEQPRHLSASDRERIGTLAADLPGLWRSPTTTGADRRAIVRLLIERVELTRQGETERVTVVVHWRGGTTTHPDVRQGLRRHTLIDGFAAFRHRVLLLRGDGLTADRIAVMLSDEGYRVARGELFTGDRVRQLLTRFGQAGVPAGVRDASDLPGRDEWWLSALAKHLGVKPIVVHRWHWSGWLQARQLRGEKGRWVVQAHAAEVKRLRRLRAFEVKHRGRRIPPEELTTPGNSWMTHSLGRSVIWCGVLCKFAVCPQGAVAVLA